MRRGTPPGLPAWANLVSPSEWLKYSRAYRRGEDKFHLACCQMKHLRTAYQLHMPLHNAPALQPPRRWRGGLVIHRASGAANLEPFRWRLKVSPIPEGWGLTTLVRLGRESRRMAGRMSANARILTALIGTNHCIPKGHAATLVEAGNPCHVIARRAQAERLSPNFIGSHTATMRVCAPLPERYGMAMICKLLFLQNAIYVPNNAHLWREPREISGCGGGVRRRRRLRARCGGGRGAHAPR